MRKPIRGAVEGPLRPVAMASFRERPIEGRVDERDPREPTGEARVGQIGKSEAQRVRGEIREARAGVFGDPSSEERHQPLNARLLDRAASASYSLERKS